MPGRLCATLCATLLFLLFAGVALAQEQPRTFRIPFHSVNGMILLDATVNGKPAVLLLDTGGRYSIVRPELAKGSRSHTVSLENAVYGSRKFSEVRVGLDGREGNVTAALVDVRAASGAEVDGILGQDILRTFAAVKIDFKTQVVELEAQ